MQITEAHNHQTIVLNTRAILDVRLEANLTTGYRWALDSVDGRFLETLGEPVYQQAGGEGLVGAGGTETWSFISARQGRTVLRMVYRRPWEDEAEPARIFEVIVDVSAYCES